MNVILDTHAAIWFVTDDKKLPQFSKKIIEDSENRCFVSIATLWEMGIKYSLGKLELKVDLGQMSECPISKSLRSVSRKSKVVDIRHLTFDLKTFDFKTLN
jgi:PIN domain nuclease of toxin-antitoxin system